MNRSAIRVEERLTAIRHQLDNQELELDKMRQELAWVKDRIPHMVQRTPFSFPKFSDALRQVGCSPPKEG